MSSDSKSLSDDKTIFNKLTNSLHQEKNPINLPINTNNLENTNDSSIFSNNQNDISSINNNKNHLKPKILIQSSQIHSFNHNAESKINLSIFKKKFKFINLFVETIELLRKNLILFPIIILIIILGIIFFIYILFIVLTLIFQTMLLIGKIIDLHYHKKNYYTNIIEAFTQSDFSNLITVFNSLIAGIGICTGFFVYFYNRNKDKKEASNNIKNLFLNIYLEKQNKELENLKSILNDQLNIKMYTNTLAKLFNMVEQDVFMFQEFFSVGNKTIILNNSFVDAILDNKNFNQIDLVINTIYNLNNDHLNDDKLKEKSSENITKNDIKLIYYQIIFMFKQMVYISNEINNHIQNLTDKLKIFEKKYKIDKIYILEINTIIKDIKLSYFDKIKYPNKHIKYLNFLESKFNKDLLSNYYKIIEDKKSTKE